jgi:predicted lipoprotein with Yx(FWY)xxD motif
MRRQVLALVLLVAGCSSSPTSGPSSSAGASSVSPTLQSSSSPSLSPSSAPTSAKPSASQQPAGTMIIAAKSNYGTILYDASGQAIYLFDAEDSDKPKCSGECAKAWPPVLTRGPGRSSGAVRPKLLGTTPRSDGGTQITYAGHPLYFYAHEGKYQVLCHNIQEFGGTWLVVQPDGKPAPA